VLQRRGRKSNEERSAHRCISPTETIEQPNDWGGCNVFSNATRTDQLPFSITGINQERTPPEPSLGGPIQISSRLAEPAGSADGAVVGDVASSFSRSRMLTYGAGQGNACGRGLTSKTPRSIERRLQWTYKLYVEDFSPFTAFLIFYSPANSDLR
jgi:hypothetical protein